MELEVVANDEQSDPSVVTLNTHVMEKLGLFRGDTIMLKNEENSLCYVAIVLCSNSSDLSEGEYIELNTIVRNNLMAEIGDKIMVSVEELKYGERLVVAPYLDTVGNLSNSEIEGEIKSYFLEAYRPVIKGWLT